MYTYELDKHCWKLVKIIVTVPFLILLLYIYNFERGFGIVKYKVA